MLMRPLMGLSGSQLLTFCLNYFHGRQKINQGLKTSGCLGFPGNCGMPDFCIFMGNSLPPRVHLGELQFFKHRAEEKKPRGCSGPKYLNSPEVKGRFYPCPKTEHRTVKGCLVFLFSAQYIRLSAREVANYSWKPPLVAPGG